MKIALSRGLVGIALTLGFFAIQFAYADHTWGNYHWARTANPFTLKVGDNLTASWKPYLAQTSGAWSQSNVLDTTIVLGLGGNNCKAQTGRIEVCNRTYGYNGWLGIAQIWISGAHITKGTAKMNDSYFKLSQYNNPNEKLHVMCQEVGHLFGLGHTSEDGTSQQTCMDYSNSPESTLPNAHDYEELALIYAHLDSTTTVSPLTSSSLKDDVDMDDPKNWGQEISRTKGGHASIFEKDLGNGHKVLTHVYWAEPLRGEKGAAH